jgi:hypothetical protein
MWYVCGQVRLAGVAFFPQVLYDDTCGARLVAAVYKNHQHHPWPIVNHSFLNLSCNYTKQKGL